MVYTIQVIGLLYARARSGVNGTCSMDIKPALTRLGVCRKGAVMQLLEERILKDGKVFPGNVLKVDSFLNHQLDVALLKKLGEEIYRLFDDCGVTKILTIEASGIAIAILTAQFFNCSVLFAKKSKTSNLSSDVYSTFVKSYTHNTTYKVQVSKEYLLPGDRVLIIDDFLANGEAMRGLIDLIGQAGASLVGCVAAVEKGFQGGGDALRAEGIRVESLAIVESMDNGKIVFRKD